MENEQAADVIPAVFEEADFRALQYQSHGKLFGLLLKTALLTVVTLGIYRFWQKARLRRYYWSATTLDGDKLEYTGTGLEKFIGFLIAVILMSVYLLLATFLGNFLFLSTVGIGIFDFFGLNYELSTMLTPYVVLLLLLPFLYFAEYRALRYRAGRTEWRAIRFGCEKAAWGYAWRSIGYFALNVLSLGLLVPYAYFKKSKYKLDRVWFGDNKFAVNGAARGFYRYFLPLYVNLMIIFIALGVTSAQPYVGGNQGVVLSSVTFIAALILVPNYIYYYVRTRSHLIGMITLGNNGIAFQARLRARKVALVYFFGAIATFGFLIVLVLLITLIMAALFLSIGMNFGPDVINSFDTMEEPSPIIVFAFMGVGILFYMSALIGGFIINQMVIFEPILAHVVNETAIMKSDELLNIQQRPEDDIVDADGFADALDVGAGF